MLTLSAANTYSGGTTVNSGTIVATNALSLSINRVTLNTGTELRVMGTFSMPSEVIFASGTTGATLSATAGSTLTLGGLDVSNTSALTFGSKGNTGTIVIDGGVTAPNAVAVEVAFGTLQDGTNLDVLVNSPGGSITVDKGATLALNGRSMTVGNLGGAGSVTLGLNSGAVLTVAPTVATSEFDGVISGSGQINVNAANSTKTFILTGANTYTGGTTTLAGGSTLANNPTGSATGTGAVTIQTGATLGGSGTIKGALDLEGGTIAPSGGVSAAPATTLHGSSLLWDTGALQFQIGSKSDELLLSSTLTKGTGGPFDIDILAANGGSSIPTGTYTLLQFAATTFAQTDFTLELPNNISGNLIETKTALELQITLNERPASTFADTDTSAPLADSSSTDSAPLVADPPLSATPDLTPTPEPGSALLLACGGSLLLGYRRRRRGR